MTNRTVHGSHPIYLRTAEEQRRQALSIPESDDAKTFHTYAEMTLMSKLILYTVLS